MKIFPTTSNVNGKQGIPAIPANKVFLQYAKSQGLPFWTVEQRMKVISRYINFQSLKN